MLRHEKPFESQNIASCQKFKNGEKGMSGFETKSNQMIKNPRLRKNSMLITSYEVCQVSIFLSASLKINDLRCP